MAGDLMNMRDRQDRLEGRVAVLESTVEQEATLRAGMDEELSGLKVQKKMLQALIDTQSDHTKRLTRVEDRLGSVEDRLGSVEDRLGSVEEEIGTVRIGVHAILDLLDTHLARKSMLARLAGLVKQGRSHGAISGGS
jgi:chromosome segregation ATPase